MTHPLPYLRSSMALLIFTFSFLTTHQLSAQEEDIDSTFVPFAVYLEAECGIVGDSFDIRSNDTLASAGSYVAANQDSSSLDSVISIPSNILSITVNVPETGRLNIWARVKGFNSFTDSYYVRINGGEWRAWSETLRGDFDTWIWRPIIGSPYRNLPAGELTIEFATRERRTQIDNIYITNLNETPEGLGGPAVNCEPLQCSLDSVDCTGEFWIDAECGVLDDTRYRYLKSHMSSNGGHLQLLGPPFGTEAPTETDTISPLVYTTPEDFPAGDYAMYFLTSTPQGQSFNSFWVQIDDGDWTNFSTDETGVPLDTSEFIWVRVNDGSGDTLTYSLEEGAHTIRVLAREANTLLDKIFIGPDSTATTPTGFGKVQLNCQFNSLTPTREVSVALPGVKIFPNPVHQQLTVTLEDAGVGPLDLRVFDATGRLLQQRRYQTNGGLFKEVVPVDRLPSGIYQAVLTTPKGRAVKTFVKR